MATFVLLATCHHCPVVTSRRGLVYRDSLSALVYRDSLSALSRNLRAPGLGGPCGPRGPGLQGLYSKQHSRLSRPHLPQSIALSRSKPPGSARHLVLAHLRKLLVLKSTRQRGLHLPV